MIRPDPDEDARLDLRLTESQFRSAWNTLDMQDKWRHVVAIQGEEKLWVTFKWNDDREWDCAQIYYYRMRMVLKYYGLWK